MQAEPDVTLRERAAAGDDAVGFMQIGEHQIEIALQLRLGDGRIKLARAARQLGQLAPRLSAAVANHAVIQPFRQRVVANVAQ